MPFLFLQVNQRILLTKLASTVLLGEMFDKPPLATRQRMALTFLSYPTQQLRQFLMLSHYQLRMLFQKEFFQPTLYSLVSISPLFSEVMVQWRSSPGFSDSTFPIGQFD